MLICCLSNFQTSDIFPGVYNLWHVLADAGDDDAGALRLGLVHEDFAHDAAIVVVEMRDGFVGEDEVEGLHEGTHQCHTLLLSERHAPHLGLGLVGDAQHVEPLKYLFAGLEIGEFVLDFHILKGCQFGKEAQLLEQGADMTHAYAHPLGNTELPGVLVVEQYLSVVVVAIALDIAAESAFPLAALCLDEVEFFFLETHVLLPDVAMLLFSRCEDVGYDVMKLYGIHFFS